MPLAETHIKSRLLGNERRVWVQQPGEDRRARAICVLLDGEYYVERMAVTQQLADLQASRQLPPLAIFYVSHVDGPARWHESFCNTRFAQFVGDELIPWTRDLLQGQLDSQPVILGGLSLTGLAAAHAALVQPKAVAGVFCQSASFWWSDNQLVRDVLDGNHAPQRFRIVCGSRETEDYVDHGSGLVQRTSQLESNQKMRDALLKRGHTVSYEEFDGGHDLASWEADLPRSLEALLDHPS